MHGYWENDIEEIEISEKDISRRLEELAAQLEHDFAGKNALFICILNGACVFYTDLLMHMDMQTPMYFMRVSSYGNSTESGDLRLILDIDADVSGRDIVLVEDIIDTGNTLFKLRNMLLERGAASVRTACMFDKPSRRKADIKPDYLGFTVPDKFLVGYGLDFAGKYRNLPFVGTLKPELYE